MKAGFCRLAVFSLWKPRQTTTGKMGRMLRKVLAGRGNSSHCQNLTQTPPSLFILKNKDLNLKEEDQLNVQSGELGKNNGGHH